MHGTIHMMSGNIRGEGGDIFLKEEVTLKMWKEGKVKD